MPYRRQTFGEALQPYLYNIASMVSQDIMQKGKEEKNFQNNMNEEQAQRAAYTKAVSENIVPGQQLFLNKIKNNETPKAQINAAPGAIARDEAQQYYLNKIKNNQELPRGIWNNNPFQGQQAYTPDLERTADSTKRIFSDQRDLANKIVSGQGTLQDYLNISDPDILKSVKDGMQIMRYNESLKPTVKEPEVRFVNGSYYITDLTTGETKTVSVPGLSVEKTFGVGGSVDKGVIKGYNDDISEIFRLQGVEKGNWTKLDELEQGVIDYYAGLSATDQKEYEDNLSAKAKEHFYRIIDKYKRSDEDNKFVEKKIREREARKQGLMWDVRSRLAANNPNDIKVLNDIEKDIPQNLDMQAQLGAFTAAVQQAIKDKDFSNDSIPLLLRYYAVGKYGSFYESAIMPNIFKNIYQTVEDADY